MPQALKKSRKSRLGHLARAALVAASALALTIGLTGSAHAGVLTPLSERATSFQKQFQPVFDYDGNGCLPVAAIDNSGNLNGGLDDSGSVTGQCRSGHLGKANTYSRAKCNNGWCGIIYTLYFEKDMACADCVVSSHRHDWESAVIWIRQGASTPTYVSVSRHGNYSTKQFSEVPKDGVRIKVVYHKDGGSTHVFRFAKDGEAAEAWSDGGWDFPALVSWDNFNNGSSVDLRGKMNSATWGDANFPLKDSRFGEELSRAKRDAAAGISFDPWA